MQASIEHVKTLLDLMPEEADYPEIWSTLRDNVLHGVSGEMQELIDTLTALCEAPQEEDIERRLRVLLLVARAVCGDASEAAAGLEQLMVERSQDLMIAGALFFVLGLLNPGNPKYDLANRFCINPFVRVDVLENGTHQCCASFLPLSIGNMTEMAWESAWNSREAKAVRESMHDGSFRYCNKMLCPSLQAGELQHKEKIAAKSNDWKAIIDYRATHMPRGPKTVNLSYDRTCNLSCPSCRSEKYAASSEMRVIFDDLQNRSIAPMLRTAELTHITGSGDPFASKNFRNLLKKLNKDEYPDLKIQIMTNGMLFTPEEWAKFPNLKGMVSIVRLSVDAARGPTHELLRRGAKWDVMLKNMEFIGQLRARGEILKYGLAFVVQQENFTEMGEAVDLAKRMGADHVYFGKLSNWGTFDPKEFEEKYIFVDTHPDHEQFLACMADPRIQDPMVINSELRDFLPA